MISLSNICKRYDKTEVLHDLTFSIEPGRIVGLLGPNGAGKSTTLNILTGCLAPTSGQVNIFGTDLLDDPRNAKRHLGYLPEHPPLYHDMTVREYLDFVAEAKGISRRERADAVVRAMKSTDVVHEQNRLLYKLSKGTRQRVGIAQAILGNPDCIVLDEPTIGLDPRQITEIRSLISTLGRDHTVLISSHILSEIDSLCDQVLILSHGKLVAQDTPDNLTGRLKTSAAVRLLVRSSEEKLRQALGVLPHLSSIQIEPGAEANTMSVALAFDGLRDPREQISAALASKGLYPIEIRMEKARLEDVFLELTEDTGEEKEANA